MIRKFIIFSAIFFLLHTHDALDGGRRRTEIDFDITVIFMSSLARVLNGIHIQQALINGTIPPEKLVAELLNLGSTTFKDIESVDIEEVEKLAESMNGLHSMIQDDSEVEWLERRPEMWPILQTAPHFGDIRHPWTRVRAYSEILDVAALGNDDYMKELKAFKANIAEEQNREKLAEKITNLFNAILELRKTDLADAEIKTKISWIVSVLEEFVTIDLAPYEAAKYQQLRQGDVAFSSLATIWALLSPQKSVLPVSQDKPIIESITGLLGNLSTVATSVTISAIRDCRIMCHLFVSSSNRNETAKLEYTHGFPNGVSDLEMMISKDLTNKWINKTTKGNAGKLAKALSQLANLTENLKSIDQSMRLGSSDSNGVSDYCQELASLASIANQTDLVAKHISEIASFNIPNDLSPSNGEKIDALLAAIDGLRGTLYSIDEMIKLVRIHKDSNSFAKMLEIFKKSSLEEIRTGAEVKRFIETAEKRMSAMYHLHYHHLADKIDGIAANYTEINAYFTGLAPFFDKIQEMKKIEGAESLKGVLDQIKEFRSKRRYEISSDLFQNLADLKNQTKKLEELIEKTKGFKSLETDELMSKRSIEKEAVTIGESAAALRKVQMLLAFGSPFKKMTKANLVTFKKNIELDDQDKETLDQLASFDLLQFVDQFRDIIAENPPMKKPKLTDQSQLFTKISRIKEFTLDLKKIIETFEKVPVDVFGQSKLPELDSWVIGPLAELETIGPNLAAYSSSMSITTKMLESTDQWFTAYSPQIPATPKIPKITVTSSEPSVEQSFWKK